MLFTPGVTKLNVTDKGSVCSGFLQMCNIPALE